MKFIYFLIYLNTIFLVNSHISEDEIISAIDDKIITCGSILRIQNTMTGF